MSRSLHEENMKKKMETFKKKCWDNDWNTPCCDEHNSQPLCPTQCYRDGRD